MGCVDILMSEWAETLVFVEERQGQALRSEESGVYIDSYTVQSRSCTSIDSSLFMSRDRQGGTLGHTPLEGHLAHASIAARTL